ncbi:hypothetical protein KKB44_02265 [Candidatus Micrarchaeota archaeon]|nr:hypothetical protein [Candidatus Micrarchaeota archaeon]
MKLQKTSSRQETQLGTTIKKFSVLLAGPAILGCSANHTIISNNEPASAFTCPAPQDHTDHRVEIANLGDMITIGNFAIFIKGIGQNNDVKHTTIDIYDLVNCVQVVENRRIDERNTVAFSLQDPHTREATHLFVTVQLVLHDIESRVAIFVR